MAGFPGISTTVDDMIAAEDKVVARWSAVGTNQDVMQAIAPTNRKIAQNGIVFIGSPLAKLLMNG